VPDCAVLFTADEPVVVCPAFDAVDVEETVDVEGALAFPVSTLALSAVVVSPLVVSADAVSPWEAFLASSKSIAAEVFHCRGGCFDPSHVHVGADGQYHDWRAR
jgi:hypothetical protein